MTRARQEGANAKLTKELVINIRKRLAAGDTQSSLCRAYGVSIVTIGRIARRETWNWLKEDESGIAPGNWREPDMSQPLTVEEQAAAEASLTRLQAILAKDGIKTE